MHYSPLTCLGKKPSGQRAVTPCQGCEAHDEGQPWLCLPTASAQPLWGSTAQGCGQRSLKSDFLIHLDEFYKILVFKHASHSLNSAEVYWGDNREPHLGAEE